MNIVLKIILLFLTSLACVALSLEFGPVDLEWDLKMSVRLPRVVLSFLVGGALGVAGLICQAVFRNQIATPSILGIESFASLAGALSILLFADSFWYMTMPIATLAGTFCFILMLTYLLNYGFFGRAQFAQRILILGFSINAMLGALTSLIVLLMAQNHPREANIFYWMFGDLNSRSWDHVLLSFLGILMVSPVLFFKIYELNLFSFNSDQARALGLSERSSILLHLCCCGILVGSSSAAAGSIPFVGFIAPFVARLIVGNGTRRLCLASFFMGSILVITADFVARFMLYPLDVPAGILIAIIGTPLLIYASWNQESPIANGNS